VGWHLRGAGYLFGNIPAVKNNFELVVIGIVFVSVIPLIVETVKAWRRGSPTPKEPSVAAANPPGAHDR